MHRDSQENRKKLPLAIIAAAAALLLLFAQTGAVFAASEAPPTQCKSIYLYDQTTGDVLYEKKADEPRTPASLTKIMTAILVLENVEDLDAVMTIPEDAVFQVGSHMSLVEGEQLTVRQVLEALMVTSANDGAKALAIYVAGSEEAFVGMMNAKAREIGAYDTHYLNPNGYTESWDHVTTAKDLAKITDYAFTVSGFSDLVSLKSVTIPATNKSEERIYRNTNLLLWDTRQSLTMWDGTVRAPLYEGTFGVKTGMMARSGYCLIAGCERNGMRLIAVCLKGGDEDDRFEDSIALFDWAFDNYETVHLIASGTDCGEVKIEGGNPETVHGYCEEGVTVTRDKTVSGSDEVEIVFYESLQAPLAAGDRVGYVSYINTAGEHARVPITLREDVPKSVTMRTIGVIGGAAMLVLAAIVLLLRSEHRKKKTAEEETPENDDEKDDDENR